MPTRSSDRFPTVRTEGAILPADLLQRIASGENGLPGMTPSSYHLIEGEKLNEATNRAWNRLQSAWASFRAASDKLSSTDLGVGTTRERWLLPMFQEFGYGRLQPLKDAFSVQEKYYPVSHVWGHVPIHFAGCRMDLDKRTAGSPSSHSLVQEFLNRSKAHLWGFVSNGFRFRILRDNIRLTRQAYVEFDVQAMFDGKIYPDFSLLWRLCHQSRVEADKPQECWLEQWSKAAQQHGLRVLDQLRGGVEQAIAALGSGFLACPANLQLRNQLRSGKLDAQEYYRQLLRLVYRLLFLFVAEDRELLFNPLSREVARNHYRRFYSAARLRQQAERLRGTQHTDLYQMLSLVMEKLGSTTGCPELGLPALGSFLFSPQAVPDLEGCHLANADLLAAIRALALTSDGQALRPVDYRNLGSEELGSIYESLLELHPQFHAEAATFELRSTSGNERKTTGSYYTPTSLITCLLDSALDPVLKEAARKPGAEAAILGLKVCDPACGSGHFLIAAAHRIAKQLACVRTGEEEPPPEAVSTALRDVIGHCVYGVDINPMAVELCKVALWMEALTPGKPLSFLDHHVQCGNSLLGATPALLSQGIIDKAFEPIEGDDRVLCRGFKKQNHDECRGQRNLFDGDDAPWNRMGDLATVMESLEQESDDTLAAVQRKQDRYAELVHSSGYQFGRLWADSWCAAFVWRKDRTFDFSITERIFRQVERSPHHLTPWMRDEIQRLASQYEFFHWHMAFPDVFRVPGHDEEPENETTGWSGGFDVVLGNPPWERIKLQEQEWFAQRRPDIAQAPAAKRRRMIAELADKDPPLYRAFIDDCRRAEGESHLVRHSGRYPLCGRGDVNTYTLFAEMNRMFINPTGRVGCIVPSGIATDDTTKIFWVFAFFGGYFSQFWEHAGQDFQPEVLLIPEAVRPPLDGTDLVVDAFHETQRHLVLRAAIGLDPVPVRCHHAGEALEGLQTLPAQRGTPLVEETPGPAGAPVVPELIEGLLEEVRLVQPAVGLEQQRQGFPPRGVEVFPVRQKRVPLPFDEAPVLARHAGVFPPAHLVHRLGQVHQDVELVVHDRGLGSVPLLEGGVTERLPHVHDRHADFAAFFWAQPGKELVQAGLGTVHAAKPDGTTTLQVADDDAVLVPPGDGDFVDADDPGRRGADPAKLRAHVLLVQLLDGVPIEEEFFGHLLDGRLATAAAHEEGEPLGIERVVGQPVEALVLHAATP